MIKHQIPARYGGHTCAVGYDGESDSFFAVVEDPSVEEVAVEALDRIVEAFRRDDAPIPADFVIAGRNATFFSPAAVRSVEELADLMSPFAEVTRETVELLQADRRRARGSGELDAVVAV